MKAHFCPTCGTPRIEGAGFCGSCGMDFGAVSAGPAPSPVPPTPAPVPPSPDPPVRPPGPKQPLPPTAPPIAVPAPAGAPRADRPTRAEGWGSPNPLALIALFGGIALIGLVVVGAAILASNGAHTPSASPPSGGAGVDLPAASLDPDAPAFPVPSGATLRNAQITGGTGPSAARLAAWTSPLAFDATVAFYATLTDARWVRGGPPATTPQSATVGFTDASVVLASADVTISRTDPVGIAVVFLPLTRVSPAPSSAPGPTIAFASLPPATALPAAFPSQFVPANSRLVDAGSVGGTDYAIFASSSDSATLAAAFQAGLAGLATGLTSRTEGLAGGSILDIRFKDPTASRDQVKAVLTAQGLSGATVTGTSDGFYLIQNSTPIANIDQVRTALEAALGPIDAERLAIVLDFTTSGHPGEIVLTPDPSTGGTTVSVQVSP